MTALSDFYISRPPNFRPLDHCQCPKLTAQPTDPAFWPWSVRNSTELAAYVAGLGDEVTEHLLAFYTDVHLNLLAIDAFADDNPQAVDVPIGRILCRGHHLGAQGLILVHNHPSQDARPSEADVAVTRRVLLAAEAMGISLLEHVICAGVEMRRMGLL